jgi:hypothetical protein
MAPDEETVWPPKYLDAARVLAFGGSECQAAKRSGVSLTQFRRANRFGTKWFTPEQFWDVVAKIRRTEGISSLTNQYKQAFAMLERVKDPTHHDAVEHLRHLNSLEFPQAQPGMITQTTQTTIQGPSELVKFLGDVIQRKQGADVQMEGEERSGPDHQAGPGPSQGSG